jgi:hypothetical protein
MFRRCPSLQISVREIKSSWILGLKLVYLLGFYWPEGMAREIDSSIANEET